MKFFNVILLCVWSLLAGAQGERMNPEKISYTFTKNKRIEWKGSEADRSFYPEVQDGNMVVFTYTKQSAENPDMTDDEKSESIMFEVNPSWNSFIFIKKLPMSKATYNLGCFCAERGYFKISGGYIRGRKLANGHYFVEADAEITFSNGVKKSVKFKGEFTPADAG